MRWWITCSIPLRRVNSRSWRTMRYLRWRRSDCSRVAQSYRCGFKMLYLLKDKYPVIYKQVEKRLETGWETTIQLLEQGMAEGVIRKVSIPIVKMMVEATVEQFFQRDILIQSGLSYLEALDEVVSILQTESGSEAADKTRNAGRWQAKVEHGEQSIFK